MKLRLYLFDRQREQNGVTRGDSDTARRLTTQNTPPVGNDTDSVVVEVSF